MARDAWQTDAAIAALEADVTRVPLLEPYDWKRDGDSEARYEETEADREDEETKQRRMRLDGPVRAGEELEPW